MNIFCMHLHCLINDSLTLYCVAAICVSILSVRNCSSGLRYGECVGSVDMSVYVLLNVDCRNSYCLCCCIHVVSVGNRDGSASIISVTMRSGVVLANSAISIVSVTSCCTLYFFLLPSYVPALFLFFYGTHTHK